IPLLLYNVDNTSIEKIKNNISLYDAITNSLGENIIGNKYNSNYHYLFYGSLNKRFRKEIKKVLIENNYD